MASKTFGTLLQRGDAATPEKFTTVAVLQEINPPQAVSETVETTTHDSTVAEFINTYVDEGEITARGLFTNTADSTNVRGDLGGATDNWQICFPDFGSVTDTFTTDFGTDDRLDATAHGLTTGQPVQVSSTTTLPAGLSASTIYYVAWVSANEITLHTTNAAAVAGTGAVDITDDGTGTHTINAGVRLDFAGLVTAYGLEPAGLRDALGQSIGIKITGAVTYKTS
jgi:hypothetical protein